MPDAPMLGASRKVALDEGAFAARFNGPLVHQSVRAEQAARRRGTAATKTRGEVSGGGAKPWRQKGTGRARAGSSRSPVWTGGGIVFGPQPRSYTFKVNRKEQRAALRSALSLHAERGSLAVLDTSAFEAPKTRQARELLEGWKQPAPILVVLAPQESAAALSFRNLARTSVLAAEDVGITDVVGAASLVLSQAALDALTVRAAKPARAGDDAREGAADAGASDAGSSNDELAARAREAGEDAREEGADVGSSNDEPAARAREGADDAEGGD